MPTPNMGLTLAVDHGSADVWDVILDTIFNLIDAHDHTAGKGVKVPSAGLNINADVSWGSGGAHYAISDMKGLDFFPVAAGTMAGFADAFFVDSATNELNYRNHSGTNIQVTSGAGLNMSLVGGIGGDYAAVGALLSFDDATDSYWFQQQGGPRPWARIRTGDVDIYQTAASIVNRVRMKSPAALAASYDMTWFAALPASQVPMQIDNAGVMVASGSIPAALTLAALLTVNAGVTFGNNQNLLLQGTGYVKRGNDTRTIPVFAGSGWNFTSGSLPGYTTPGSQSPVHLVPGTYYYPIPLDSQRERAQVVTIYADAVTVDCTLSLVTDAATIGAGWAAIAGATGTIVAGGVTRTVTLTPTTPAVFAAGTTLWLKVVVPATATADIIAMDLTTDVP